MACCMSGCYVFDANLPRPKAEYGQVQANSIAVNALMGFRKPGVHHVPRGTTLRQFLKIAQILPERDWNGQRSFYGCSVSQRRHGKVSGFFAAMGPPSEKEYETVLEDGAHVKVFMLNW